MVTRKESVRKEWIVEWNGGGDSLESGKGIRCLQVWA